MRTGAQATTALLRPVAVRPPRQGGVGPEPHTWLPTLPWRRPPSCRLPAPSRSCQETACLCLSSWVRLRLDTPVSFHDLR